jgi:hypothetical protein
MGEIQPISDKTILIPDRWLYPRHTDKTFANPPDGITIFLARGVELDMSQGEPGLVKGAHYRDSLMSRIGIKGEESQRIFNRVGNNTSARFFEEYLREKFSNPQIELVHITSGINRHTMNAVRWFGYFRDPQDRIRASK